MTHKERDELQRQLFRYHAEANRHERVAAAYAGQVLGEMAAEDAIAARAAARRLQERIHTGELANMRAAATTDDERAAIDEAAAIVAAAYDDAHGDLTAALKMARAKLPKSVVANY